MRIQSLWNRAFWSEVAERAMKTSAQMVLVFLGVGFVAGTQPGAEAHIVNAFALDWVTLLGVALGGAFVSVLTSLASFGIGHHSASLFVSPTSPRNGVEADPDNSQIAG